jgi:uncharacterized membrane protein YwaF
MTKGDNSIMAWGTFGTAHILSLIFAIALNVALYFLLKRCTQKVQIIVLGILSFSGIAAIIYNLVAWDSPLEYLPFHLCSLNAMVLPIAVFTKNKVISNLTLLWSLGAAVALLLNHSVAAAEVLDPVFCFYFFPHVFEMSIPILLFKLGLCKLDAKCIASTVGITAGAYTVIHFINVALNSHCLENNITTPAGEIVQVNYMYSITPDNPVLVLFHNLIPHSFWYMLPAVLIAAVYLAAIYGIAAVFSKKKYC